MCGLLDRECATGLHECLVLQYEDECYTRAEIEAMRLLLTQHGYLYLDDSVNTVAVLLANATYTNALQGTVATGRAQH